MSKKKKKLTVDKPSTQRTRQQMSVSGKAEPGTKVSVKGHWVGEEDKHHPATAGPDGKYGAMLMTPDEEGIFEVSVSSTDATTTTTFPVKKRRR